MTDWQAELLEDSQCQLTARVSFGKEIAMVSKDDDFSKGSWMTSATSVVVTASEVERYSLLV